MSDAAILVATVGLFCLALALMAALADWWDVTEERRDAYRRNHARPKR